MDNFTLLETMLITYIIAVNVLGVITVILARYASSKVGEITLIVWLGVAIPITLPIVVYLLTFDKLKRRKSKQDLEKKV